MSASRPNKNGNRSVRVPRTDEPAADSEPARRQQILDAAARIFHRKGYDHATLDDVAREIGISKPLIYHYFKNKQELLYEVCDRATKVFHVAFNDASLASHSATQLARLIENHISILLSYRDAVSIMFNERTRLPAKTASNLAESYRTYVASVEKVYEEGVRRGEFRDLDPRVSVLVILGACN